jgi:hypothetical protein
MIFHDCGKNEAILSMSFSINEMDTIDIYKDYAWHVVPIRWNRNALCP